MICCRTVIGFGSPKRAGTPERGGNYTAAVTSTTKQHAAHTALATNSYHTLGDKALDPEGMELQSGRMALRLQFPQRVNGAGPLRAILVQMAQNARG